MALDLLLVPPGHYKHVPGNWLARDERRNAVCLLVASADAEQGQRDVTTLIEIRRGVLTLLVGGPSRTCPVRFGPEPNKSVVEATRYDTDVSPGSPVADLCSRECLWKASGPAVFH